MAVSRESHSGGEAAGFVGGVCKTHNMAADSNHTEVQNWGTRSVLPSAQPMYEAARRWRDEALIADLSLFSGEPLVGRAAAQELVEDFIGQPDEGSGSFINKLRQQLATTSAAGVQVAAELVYVRNLIVSTAAGRSRTKLDAVNQVLNIKKGETTPVPDDLAEALRGGLINPGTAYNTLGWKMLEYMIRFFETVKRLGEEQRRHALTNWEGFQSLLSGLDEQSVWSQRFTLEHLLFPESAPPVISREHRGLLGKALLGREDADSAELAEALAKLEPNVCYGDRCGVDPYMWPVKRMWHGPEEKLSTYAKWSKKVAGVVDLDEVERSYKLEKEGPLQEVFRAAREGTDLFEPVKEAFRDFNVVHYLVIDDFRKWVQRDPDRARQALLELERDPGPESIDRLLEHVPRSEFRGPGALLSLASTLLMGLDPAKYPPWRSTAADTTSRLTGGYAVQESATLGERYLYFLERLDAIQSAASAEGVVIRDRLDAQGLAWTIAKYSAEDFPRWSGDERAAFGAWQSGKPVPTVETVSPPVDEETEAPPEEESDPKAVEELAERLHMSSTDWLEETLDLLKEKKQLILQGPPGTGKTFIARELALFVAGGPERVETVQFHPGSSYEDFVQGLRPDPEDPSRFKVVDGPLVRFKSAAAEDPSNDYVLIIDEVNRANVPAVFGELYYLLEYRDEKVTLLYGEKHSLPKNLYIIATMNTADRSITSLDSAMRRRFFVQHLDPASELLQDVLRNFLEQHTPDLAWLAGLLDRANELLDDPDLAIGPSHFMGGGGEKQARRAWDHSVIPTLREYFHSDLTRVDDFDFDALKALVKPADDDADSD